MEINQTGTAVLFLSTPSARRATAGAGILTRWFWIFLSTPSARRATVAQDVGIVLFLDFYPRPPRGGRRRGPCLRHVRPKISIHALREEGDEDAGFLPSGTCQFLSTPSARRATWLVLAASLAVLISIHALREEGDCAYGVPTEEEALFLSTPSARRATCSTTA